MLVAAGRERGIELCETDCLRAVGLTVGSPSSDNASSCFRISAFSHLSAFLGLAVLAFLTMINTVSAAAIPTKTIIQGAFSIAIQAGLQDGLCTCRSRGR